MPRLPRNLPILPFLAAGLLLIAPARARAQESPTPKTFCYSGGPATRCANFLFSETEVAYPALRGARQVKWGGDQEDESVFGGRLVWEIGVMHNLGPRWSVGGGFGFGVGGDRFSTEQLRARRWLSPTLGLDLIGARTSWNPDRPGPAGCSFTWSGGCVFRQGPVKGTQLQARLNFSDDVFTGLSLEQVSIDPYRGGSSDAGGTLRSLSLVAGVGSEWAVGSTLGLAAVAAALLVLAYGT